MVRECASDLLGGSSGTALAPVAGCFVGGGVSGGGERLIAFGPVVGCLPLSFLVGA